MLYSILKWPLFKILQSDLKKKKKSKVHNQTLDLVHLHFRFCENGTILCNKYVRALMNVQNTVNPFYLASVIFRVFTA